MGREVDSEIVRLEVLNFKVLLEIYIIYIKIVNEYELLKAPLNENVLASFRSITF